MMKRFGAGAPRGIATAIRCAGVAALLAVVLVGLPGCARSDGASQAAFEQLTASIGAPGALPIGQYAVESASTIELTLPPGMKKIGAAFMCDSPAQMWTVDIGRDGSRWGSAGCSGQIVTALFDVEASDGDHVTATVTTDGPTTLYVVFFTTPEAIQPP